MTDSIKVAFAIAAFTLAVLGCTQVNVCTPGSTQMCLCPDLSNSAQVCAEDGARWAACICEGVDAGGSGGRAGGGGGSDDAGPMGVSVTCTAPGDTDLALKEEGPGTVDEATLRYFSGGALAQIDGIDCVLAADQTSGPGPVCFDRYTCGACTIEIINYEGGSRTLVGGGCPEYEGAYSLCQLTQTCDGRNCGEDSCGRSCGSCPSGQTCNGGTCGEPPCPRGCMQGRVCCGPPFCAGDCVGTPCC